MGKSHVPLYKVNDSLSIAYYWYIQGKGEDRRLSHHGGIYGMQNWMVIYPEHDLGISIFSNTSFEQTSEILLDVVESLYLQLKTHELK